MKENQGKGIVEDVRNISLTERRDDFKTKIILLVSLVKRLRMKEQYKLGSFFFKSGTEGGYLN